MIMRWMIKVNSLKKLLEDFCQHNLKMNLKCNESENTCLTARHLKVYRAPETEKCIRGLLDTFLSRLTLGEKKLMI